MFNDYNISPQILIGISVAFGIGLLIGTERERHQQQSSEDNALGVSSNTVTKVVVSSKSGGLAYAIRISAGLLLMIACCFLALIPFNL